MESTRSDWPTLSLGKDGSFRTDPELERFRLVARGLSYQEVPRRLRKSVRTVETQFRNVRLKTGATNQAELVQMCSPCL